MEHFYSLQEIGGNQQNQALEAKCLFIQIHVYCALFSEVASIAQLKKKQPPPWYFVNLCLPIRHFHLALLLTLLGKY